MRVLVTGATGHVGDRIVPALLREGHEVRCLTRAADWLRTLPWRPQVETPRWVRNLLQPIAIRDVIRFFAACATSLPGDVNRAFNLGGADVLTYVSMM